MPTMNTLGAAAVRSFGLLRKRGLFNFPVNTSFTFSQGPATTSTGPTYNQLTSFYNTTTSPWLLTQYFSVPTNGFQRMVIPGSGTYRITAAGAKGAYSQTTGSISTGGNGGIITADFVFVEGTVLYFVVGQTGENDTDNGQNVNIGGFNGGGDGYYNGAGGSGGSDVRLTGTSLSDRILVGGGGAGGSHGGSGGQGGYPSGTSGVGGSAGTQSSGFSLGVGQGRQTSTTCIGGAGGGYWGGSIDNVSTHGSTGGGGSSFYNTSLGTLVSNTTGGNNGAGYITLQRIS